MENIIFITAERLLYFTMNIENDIYKGIPNTPPHFEKLEKELHALVYELRNPTIFTSLSSADTSWDVALFLDEVIYNNNFKGRN